MRERDLPFSELINIVAIVLLHVVMACLFVQDVEAVRNGFELLFVHGR